jgi:DNA-binding LacI/PurR family transcriptional regulator
MGIRELARELQLSIGTVSRALNDQPDVSPVTRARVKAAAMQQGYVPNQSGRSLRRGSTGIAAAVVPTVPIDRNTHAALFGVLEGVRRTLIQHDLELILLFRGPNEDPLENLKRTVSKRIADGLIITQSKRDEPRIAFLQQAKVPFTAFGRNASQEGYCWVDYDYEGAAAQAVDRFVAEGHRRIGLIFSDSPMALFDILADAARQRAARHGLPTDAIDVYRLQHYPPKPEDLARLSAGDAPTALMAINDEMAYGIYKFMARLGRPVGLTTALVSVVPHPMKRNVMPELSRFTVDFDAIGVALASQLLAQLPDFRPAAAVPERLRIPLELVLGNGQAAAPSRHGPVTA